MTEAPAAPVCRTCGAPAELGQEYCLECGNRLLPPRRPPAVAAWVVPALLALAVATGGAAAAIAATHDHTDRRRGAFVALTPLAPAPPPPAAASGRPTKTGATAQKLIAWPATNGYTIVLASLPLSDGAGAARAKALAALRGGLRDVGVLVSSSYPSLQPGYYIVFSGVFPSLAEAQSSLNDAKAAFPGAYARPVAR